VNGVAEELAFYESLGDWKKSESYLSEIEKVTPARVVGAAKKYLHPENLSGFEYLPQGATPTSPEATYPQSLKKVDAATERRSEQELPVTAQFSMTQKPSRPTSSSPCRSDRFSAGPTCMFWKIIGCR
jgi:hypothetical protein